MSFGVRVMESPSVVWKIALPHVDRSCESPAFSLNGREVNWTIIGHSFPNQWDRYRRAIIFEEWHFKLKYKSTQSNTSVTCYVEKNSGELERFFVGDTGSSITLNRTKLSNIGITGDVVSMIFVFDCHSKCSKDVLKDPATTEKEATSSKWNQPWERPSIHAPCLQDFCDNIEKLLDNPEYSDAVLKCGDRSFSVNKNILSVRSEVFAAMFRNKMSEGQTGMVEIKDMESSVLEQFLRFVYSGRLDAPSMVSAFDLYKFGDKYAVPSLQRKCASFMVDNLSEDSICEVLLVADTFRDIELLDIATDFAVSRVGFLGSAAWNDFAEEHPASAVKVYKKFHTK